MKILITCLIFGGLVSLMAEAHSWGLFLISKGVGIAAMSTGAYLAIREEKRGRI